MHPPIALKVKFKSASLEQFAAQYGPDLNNEGIFIRTPRPFLVGTPVRFDLQLQDGNLVLCGQGTVVWTLALKPGQVSGEAGMGVRFDELSNESKDILSKVIELKNTNVFQPTEIQNVLSSQIVPLKVQLQSKSLEEFIVQYGTEITPQNIFVRTNNTLPVGTRVKFDLQLHNKTTLLDGEGTIVWVLKSNKQTGVASGMAVRFDHLSEQSSSVLEQVLFTKGDQYIQSSELSETGLSEAKTTEYRPKEHEIEIESPQIQEQIPKESKDLLSAMASSNKEEEAAPVQTVTPIPNPIKQQSSLVWPWILGFIVLAGIAVGIYFVIK